MATKQLATLTRYWSKAKNVAPLVISTPKLLPLLRQGVHPEIYDRMSGSWLQQGDIRTVLDIGANTGQFSRTVRALLPQAQIYAFEPQDDCYREIQAAFKFHSKMHAVQTAVGDEDGEITFHRNEFSQSSSVLELTDTHKEAFPWAKASREITVPIHRLDTLAADFDLEPSILVKIDVQGYEDRVLRGGENTIRQADYVLIETAFEQLYEGEATFDAVYDIMVSYGFRYAGNLDQVENPKTGLPLYADALFVRA